VGISHAYLLRFLETLAFYLCGRALINITPRAPSRFMRGFEVAASPEDISSVGTVDYLWLCVSSPQLRDGNGQWVVDLVRAMGKECTVINMSPGLDDNLFLQKLLVAKGFGHETEVKSRVIHGSIGFASYQAPLRGEHIEKSATHTRAEADAAMASPAPGLKYGDSIASLHPPMSKSMFFAPSTEGVKSPKLQTLVKTLSAGGVPAGASTVPPNEVTILPVAAIHPILAGLELSNWKFREFVKGPHFEKSVEAVKVSKY
jgi:hypothetical protein